MKKRFAIVVIAAATAAALASAGCAQMCRRCGEVVKVTVLEGVHFDFDRAVIKPEGKIVLDKDVELLKKDQTLDISVEGHCDIVGSDAYNQVLSERRAKVVFDHFLKGGIEAARMKTVGYGRSKPVVPNDSATNRAKNRRVEIQIIKARP